MNVMVLGGAGYIGSHAVKGLLNNNHKVIVVDSLETGHVSSVPREAEFFKCDIRDTASLDSIFDQNNIDAVIHFAANSLVGESVINPLKYFDNNVGGAISLVKSMAKHNVKSIVFSSTAATYGEPRSIPILEGDPTEPTNPYGETKLAMEKLFKWSDKAYGIKYVSLRYFNVAGADESGEIGEDHDSETHLIPLIMQVPLGKRESVSIFGTDYNTKDGSCVRDYIHVTDLVDAHILAMNYLHDGGDSDVFNLGNGVGFTVKEVIESARKVTLHPIPIVESQRRAGDPSQLIASSEKAISVLGWKPQRAELEDIIGSAWKWHSSHPNGYEEDRG